MAEYCNYDCMGMSEGYTRIFSHTTDLYNFLTPEEKLLSEESFKAARPFSEGHAAVQRLNERWYYLRKDGTIIPQVSDGFYFAENFKEGFAMVGINKKGDINFLAFDGNLLSKKEYDEAYEFANGFARVHLPGKGWNYLKPDGTHLSKVYFKDATDFEDGFAMVLCEKGWNFLTTEGTLLSKIYFEKAESFCNGFAKVFFDDKWHFLKQDGTIINVDEEFVDVENFCEGFARGVNSEGKWNFINETGKAIGENWYYYAYDFENGFAIVILDNKEVNFITPDGNLLCNENFSDTPGFTPDGVALIERLDGTYNFLNTDGTIMSAVNFENASEFEDGIAVVCLDHKYNYLKLDGSYLFEEWREKELPSLPIDEF